MKVKIITDDYDTLSEDLKRYFQKTYMGISKNKIYDVFAVSYWENFHFYLIINDYEVPDWIPSNACMIKDNTIQHDWILNVFNGKLKMLLGPEFIAKDEETYTSMVLLEPDSVKKLWERINNKTE